MTDEVNPNVDAIPDRYKRRTRWLLWDASAESPRRPHWRGDFFGVSWNDPNDWHTFDEAVAAAQECDTWGIGYVVQPEDSEFIIDIDRPYDETGAPRDWFPGLERFADAGAYMEWSPSGNGIHIPVGGEVPEWWRDCEVGPDTHQGVDVLTNKFCTFTGDTLDESGETVTDINPDPFLFAVYHAIRGETPRIDADDSDGDSAGDSTEYDGDEWLSDSDVEAALDELDPDLAHNEWIRLGYAVYDYDSGSTGKALFEQWSREGDKWDAAAQRSIDSIWNGGASEISVATLVREAKHAGWDPTTKTQADGGTATQDSAPDDDRTPTSDELSPPAVLDAARSDPFGRLTWPGDPDAGDDTEKPSIHDLRPHEAATYVWEVMQETDRDDVLAVSNDTLRAYDSGVWDADGEQRLREYGSKALTSAYSTNVLSQLVERARTEAMFHPDELGAPPGTLATDNGLLRLLGDGDVDTDDLAQEFGGARMIDLERGHLAIRRANVEYDPNAPKPNRWLTFLDEVLRDDEDRQKFQEYAGYTLWHHAQPFGKAMFLVGPTDSGKGTALKAIEAVLGSDNVASESLYDLIQTRWGPAQIYDKAANIRNEVTPGGLKNVQKFKELTGGEDRIPAEFKGKDKFTFTVTQKFLFATNEVPRIEHAGEPFYNRCLFVRFPTTIPVEEQNPDLLNELRNEKSGILNWMLDGLERLMDQERFTGERGVGGKKELCNAFGSVLERFGHNALEITGDAADVIHKSDLHDLAQEFADENDHEPGWSRQSGFTSRLKNVDAGISDAQSRRVTDDGTNTKVFTGVRLREDILDHIDTDVRTATDDDQDDDGRQDTIN